MASVMPVRSLAVARVRTTLLLLPDSSPRESGHSMEQHR